MQSKLEFGKRLLLVLILFTVAVGSPALINAQSQIAGRVIAAGPALQTPVTFKNPLAYVGLNGNVYITDENSGAGQPVTGDSVGGPSTTYPFIGRSLWYGQFTWSPDGKMLAFSERVNKTVTVVESGKAPVVVAKGVDSTFPPSFSPDGKEVGYVVETPTTTGENNGDRILQIQAVPAAGGAPRAVGSLTGTPWTCGGDMFDVAEIIYYSEVGVLGNSPMYFKWIKQGFLHTMGCTGGGVALSNGATDTWKNPNLHNPSLSADQTKLLAISTDAQGNNKQLNLVDLATGNLTPVTTKPNIDRAAFSADGTRIVYSTIDPGTTPVKGADNNAVGKQLFETFWPASGADNTIQVWSMPVAGGDSTLIYKSGGRGVGYISPAHHAPQVAFSITTSLVKMINSINAGNPANTALEVSPHPEVITAVLDNTAPPQIVAKGGQPSYGPGAEFAVLPAQPSAAAPTLVGVAPTLVQVPTLAPTVAPIVVTATSFLPTPTVGIVGASGGVCPGFLPSRLVSPGQGRILPGRANRLRASPSTGAILTNIPAGGVFDVLDNNKVCTSDGIAWWHVRYNGIEGWTAEGTGTSYWTERYTGGPTSPPPPGPGTFGIVGVTASVNPANSNTCPQTFNFTGQIVVNAPGTVTYRWERSDGATGPTQTWNATAGALTKDESTSWSGLSSTMSGWQRIHVLTPNDVFSNQASFTLVCGGGGMAVSAVSASVNPPSSNSCPQLFTFTGTITTTGPGNVTYRWERSDGAGSSDQTITFGSGGSQNVSTTWNRGVTGEGWMRLHVTAPNDLQSGNATFTQTCP